MRPNCLPYCSSPLGNSRPSQRFTCGVNHCWMSLCYTPICTGSLLVIPRRHFLRGLRIRLLFVTLVVRSFLSFSLFVIPRCLIPSAHSLRARILLVMCRLSVLWKLWLLNYWNMIRRQPFCYFGNLCLYLPSHIRAHRRPTWVFSLQNIRTWITEMWF